MSTEEELVKKAIDLLSEHFDCVQIMVSWNEQSETRDIYSGSGNWYGRIGMAHDFILCHDSQQYAEDMKDDTDRDNKEGV